MGLSYKESGVDINKGEELVEIIKKKVQATYGSRVKEGVGGFACLYEVGDRLLAAGTDGVGTKLKLAFECNIHDTVGIDLVAMCVNDIICTGAKPLFFMDYLATGKLDLSVGQDIIQGIVQACEICECALIGGETAEMPGMYNDGEYDLAGFAVGEVFPQEVLGGKKVRSGMKLLALRSHGFHSNGYSLVRKVIENLPTEEKKKYLTPTRLYWPVVKGLLKDGLVAGMAHITGGGILNIPRMNPQMGYEISLTEKSWQENVFTEEFRTIQEMGNISFHEMLKTFNCGIGLVMAIDGNHYEDIKKKLTDLNESYLELGQTTDNPGLFFAGEKYQ